MSIKISCSENHNQILGMKDQIKTLENNLLNMESLMKKMIENQNEIKQSGQKYTKSSNEDFQWVQKDDRNSDEDVTLFGTTKTSTEEYEVPAFRQVPKECKEQFFSTDDMITFFEKKFLFL